MTFIVAIIGFNFDKPNFLLLGDKLQLPSQNHRKTKIPFPFLPMNLQPVETALHYFRRGRGYSSLIVRARARSM